LVINIKSLENEWKNKRWRSVVKDVWRSHLGFLILFCKLFEFLFLFQFFSFVPTFFLFLSILLFRSNLLSLSLNSSLSFKPFSSFSLNSSIRNELLSYKEGSFLIVGRNKNYLIVYYLWSQVIFFKPVNKERFSFIRSIDFLRSWFKKLQNVNICYEGICVI